MTSIRGEVVAKHGDAEYRLVLDFNALAVFETVEGVNALEFLQQQDGSRPMNAGAMISLIYAALRRHHPEAGRDVAGDLLSDDLEILSRLVAAAMPQATGTQSGNAKRVQKA